MATITRTGALGLATITLDFDDVSLQLTRVAVDNKDTRTLNVEVSKGTLSVAPGELAERRLNAPQREAYEATLVTRADGSQRVMFSFPHRIFFS